jgi:hypothetical protein
MSVGRETPGWDGGQPCCVQCNLDLIVLFNFWCKDMFFVVVYILLSVMALDKPCAVA